MKRTFFVFFMFLFVFGCPVMADDAAPDDTNWGVPPEMNKEQYTEIYSSPSENIWNNEQYNQIYDNYGSEKSPTFLNRENMNSNGTDSDSGNGIQVGE